MSAQPFEYGNGKNRPKFSHPTNPHTTGTPSALAAWAVLIIRSVPKAIRSFFVPLQNASVSFP